MRKFLAILFAGLLVGAVGARTAIMAKADTNDDAFHFYDQDHHPKPPPLGP